MSFLRLPRELRDQIYAECLVANRSIPLNVLRVSDRSMRDRERLLGLQPHILLLCQQTYMEARSILYACNVFYVEVVAPWTYERNDLWRRCFDATSEQLEICLPCLKEDQHVFGAAHLRAPSLGAWARTVSSIRRLHVCVRPYTYLEWRMKQPTLFSRPTDACPHQLPTAIPAAEQMTLDLLVVQQMRRGLMDRDAWMVKQYWTTMAFRYETYDAELWRQHARAAASSLAERLSFIGTICAATTVSAISGSAPSIVSRFSTGESPRWLQNFLRDGILVPGSRPAEEDSPSLAYLGYCMGEHFKRTAQINGDAVFADNAGDQASKRIYNQEGS